MSQTTNTLSNQLKQDEILSMKDSRVIATSKPTVPEKTPFKKQMVNMKSQLLNHDIDVSPNFDLCITGQQTHTVTFQQFKYRQNQVQQFE